MTNDKSIIRRILIVDDNPSIHEDFRKVLCLQDVDSVLRETEAKLFGSDEAPSVIVEYEIEHAMQGEEGLQLLVNGLEANQPFDLAFVDMRMPPGWDGLTTIEKLWQADADLQVVICSAYSDHSLAAIRNRLGINDKLLILNKPFENSEVCQMASALTEKRRLARDTQRRMEELQKQVDHQTVELKRISRNDALSDILTRCSERSDFDSLRLESCCVILLEFELNHQFTSERRNSSDGAFFLAVSNCIRDTIRESDIAGRYSGDEFLIVLPQTSYDDALTLSEELSGGVMNVNLEINGVNSGSRLHTGVAKCEIGQTLEDLFAIADDALQASKNNESHLLESAQK